jgi:hypothetical protein
MSFSMTTEAVRRHEKTVTRRLGWWDLKPGTVLQAVEKAQGLRKGEHVKPICLIRVVSRRAERLGLLELKTTAEAVAETAREGFPGMTGPEFVAMFCKANRSAGVTRAWFVNRIEFEYLP